MEPEKDLTAPYVNSVGIRKKLKSKRPQENVVIKAQPLLEVGVFPDFHGHWGICLGDG